MESGNSGSLQSSSGADEECDSRAVVDSHAAFITTTHQQPYPPPPPFNHHMFDHNQINNPLFFTASPQHQLLNLDSVVWSKTLPSFSDHHFFPSSSQPAAAHTVPFSPATTMTTTAEPITSTTVPPPGGRNPKKRSRASRRAPTTVLTTDTSNFRAMVQEFTGIPAPPFTSSSSPPFLRLTTSFDLFGRPSAMMRSNTNNFDNLPQQPPYLLRPFPQKLQSSASSSSSISSLLDSSNLFTTMQNTISFPSNSFNQSSFLNPKTTQNVVSSNGYGVIGQAQIHELHTTLPDLVSSKGTAPTPTTTTPRNDDQMASGNWDDGGGGCVNYTNGKESSRVTTDHHHSPGMKGDQGFIEPWICSSD